MLMNYFITRNDLQEINKTKSFFTSLEFRTLPLNLRMGVKHSGFVGPRATGSMSVYPHEWSPWGDYVTNCHDVTIFVVSIT